MNTDAAYQSGSAEQGRPLRVRQQFLLGGEVAEQLFQPDFLVLADPVPPREILDTPDFPQPGLADFLYRDM
ncbi:hypothetical protein [Rhizobium sp. RCC_161_2]|uniref:hypothetical protein n=1 Tax=Rhizobium sp. RCC_161_2 TaxID=3239219 RepID=UPI0035245511